MRESGGGLKIKKKTSLFSSSSSSSYNVVGAWRALFKGNPKGPQERYFLQLFAGPLVPRHHNSPETPKGRGRAQKV